jgi:hypothetical protein
MKGAMLMKSVQITKRDIVYTALPLYHSAAGLIALGNVVEAGLTPSNCFYFTTGLYLLTELQVQH